MTRILIGLVLLLFIFGANHIIRAPDGSLHERRFPQHHWEPYWGPYNEWRAVPCQFGGAGIPIRIGCATWVD
jgi:hypothetical protein